MEKRTYSIGGKKYIQREIGLAQLEALLALLEDANVKSFSEITNPAAVARLARGKALAKLLAILLVPEGRPFDPEKLDEIASEFEDANIPASIAVKVIADFFAINNGWIESIGSSFAEAQEAAGRGTDTG